MTTAAKEKFYTFGIGEVFFLNQTPAGNNPDGTPRKLNLVPCSKASAITYINLAEAVMGEIQYDPSIAHKVLTAAEQSEVVKSGVAPQFAHEARPNFSAIPPPPSLAQLSHSFAAAPPTAPAAKPAPAPVAAFTSAPAVKPAPKAATRVVAKAAPVKQAAKKTAPKKAAKKAAPKKAAAKKITTKKR